MHVHRGRDIFSGLLARIVTAVNHNDGREDDREKCPWRKKTVLRWWQVWSATYLAISRPMPLVEPVTMQVRSFRGGRGKGLFRWHARILWKNISYRMLIHPLSHSIQPNASFLIIAPSLSLRTLNLFALLLLLSCCSMLPTFLPLFLQAPVPLLVRRNCANREDKKITNTSS